MSFDPYISFLLEGSRCPSDLDLAIDVASFRGRGGSIIGIGCVESGFRSLPTLTDADAIVLCLLDGFTALFSVRNLSVPGEIILVASGISVMASTRGCRGLDTGLSM